MTIHNVCSVLWDMKCLLSLFYLSLALNLMNRIIFEVALKPGAAEGNDRVWSTLRGKNVFSIYSKLSHCQILPTQIGIVRSIYVKGSGPLGSRKLGQIFLDVHTLNTTHLHYVGQCRVNYKQLQILCMEAT